MALELKQDVEQLADALTTSANESHARLLQAIKDGEITPDLARAAFQQEVLLRQHASGLYVDAAISIVQGVELAQGEFMEIIAKANDSIARIKKVEAVMDLLADLLTLSAAASAAKPKPILTAITEIGKDLADLGIKVSPRSLKV